MTASLTNSDLCILAPSSFATTPWKGISSRYRMAPTIEVSGCCESVASSP